MDESIADTFEWVHPILTSNCFLLTPLIGLTDMPVAGCTQKKEAILMSQLLIRDNFFDDLVAFSVIYPLNQGAPVNGVLGR